MAILIVDDESSTRLALRDLLTQLGHKTVLEAKNGEEGLKIAALEKSRIRLIIADWEMPYMDGITLLERVALKTELDLTPFLLITSDLPRAKLAELQARTDRLDSFLIKPFRMSALAEGMATAQAHRASMRRRIVALAPSGSLPEELRAQLAGADVASLWDAPRIARTFDEFKQAVEEEARRLGALLYCPGQEPPVDSRFSEWLAGFVRAPLGAATPVICVSRDPAVIFPLRTLCQAFLPPDSDQWALFWKGLRRSAETRLELELLFQELKSLLQKKNSLEARKLCLKILGLAPGNSEANTTLGDLHTELGKNPEALRNYWSALESNPCLPKPYIRLLENPGISAQDLARAAEAAALHCPQSPDVLFAAASAFQKIGELKNARQLARKILELSREHAGAKALLSPSS